MNRKILVSAGLLASVSMLSGCAMLGLGGGGGRGEGRGDRGPRRDGGGRGEGRGDRGPRQERSEGGNNGGGDPDHVPAFLKD